MRPHVAWILFSFSWIITIIIIHIFIKKKYIVHRRYEWYLLYYNRNLRSGKNTFFTSLSFVSAIIFSLNNKNICIIFSKRKKSLSFEEENCPLKCIMTLIFKDVDIYFLSSYINRHIMMIMEKQLLDLINALSYFFLFVIVDLVLVCLFFLWWFFIILLETNFCWTLL